MKARTYKILQECIERGLEHAVKKVFKKEDKVNADVIINQAMIDIMNEVCENFSFDEGE